MNESLYSHFSFPIIMNKNVFTYKKSGVDIKAADKFVNLISRISAKKISLATIYNTIHALKDKGYLKEISINSEKTYFDTNISNHHHFFDESKRELIDLEDKDVGKIKIKKSVPGKKITSIEVLVKIANNN